MAMSCTAPYSVWTQRDCWEIRHAIALITSKEETARAWYAPVCERGDLARTTRARAVEGQVQATESQSMTGFTITPDWITPAEEAQLAGRIRAHLGEAQKDRGRSSILRFGWNYDEKDEWVRDIPWWLQELADRLKPTVMDSVTVNQYLKGAYIFPHVDSQQFGDVIAILSLLSDAEMRLKPTVTGPVAKVGYERHIIPPRSLTTMEGESRYLWKHSIMPVKSERFSIVFRDRLLQDNEAGRLIAVKQDIYEDG